MFIVYFLLGILVLALYGMGVMYLIDELDGFDELDIDVCDYPLAFIFFWPIMVIAIFAFGIKQMIELVIDMFSVKKSRACGEVVTQWSAKPLCISSNLIVPSNM